MDWISEAFDGLWQLVLDLLQILQWILVVLLVLTPVEWVIVMIILALRETKKDVTTSIIKSPTPTGALVVHLAGFGGHGELQPRNVLAKLHERGDFMAVHYDGHYANGDANAFCPNDVVNVVVRDIVEAFNKSDGRYEWVEFLGTSMGAKLSAMIAVELNAIGIPSRGIGADPPLSWRDLVPFLKASSPLLVALRYLPWFHLALVVPRLERAVIKILFPGPKSDETDADLTVEERGILETSVKVAQGLNLSFCRDQLMFTLRRPPQSLRRSFPWTPGNWALLRSTDDKEVTSDSAIESWVKLSGQQAYVFWVEGAKHAAYGQNPSANRAALDQAYRLFNQ